MAGIKVCVASDDLTLAASGGWQTLLTCLVPSGCRWKLDSWGVLPRGAVNTDPGIRARVIKVSTAGTTAASDPVAQVTNGVGEAAQGTFKQGAFSVEPTPSGQAYDRSAVHPQVAQELPSIEPGILQFAASERFAVQIWNDSGGASIPCCAVVHLEQ